MNETILLIEDDRVLGDLLNQQLYKIGYKSHLVRLWSQARSFLSTHEPDLVLLDMKLPDAEGPQMLPELATDYPVIVLTAYGTVQSAVDAIKLGAAEYLVKPVNLDELEVAVRRTLDEAILRREHQFYKSRLQESHPRLLVGNSPGLTEVNRLIDAVAPSDMTVLIQGESGVGKELVAREVHERGLRSDRNFVPVDCCTLQEQLFESELFGHEKGAFTSADRLKKGLIEGANGGTLFLDEIGEIGPAVQAKLLRVLETGEFRRVGSEKKLSADVRIVAATNRSLQEMVDDGSFRADLFFRINAFAINVPPLRERLSDISILVNHFIHHHDFSRRIEKSVSGEAMELMMSYGWPGNVRELKNVLERAIILSGNRCRIMGDDMGLTASGEVRTFPVTLSFDHEPTMEEVSRQYLGYLLEKYSGNRLNVAQALNISERNIYRLINKFELQN